MIKGLDKLQRDLAQAQKALQELDGELCSVKFDPYDPASIEQAIQHVVDVIDNRVGVYESNPIVGPIIENMKEKAVAEAECNTVTGLKQVHHAATPLPLS